MIRSLFAGVAYFLIVFAFGFVLGALRVTFVAPALGPFWATLIELPFMLCVSWATCAILTRRLGIRGLVPAIGMGVCALTLLIGAETAFSILLFGQSAQELLASYRTAHGLLGLSGQIVFGIFPVVLHFRRPARATMPTRGPDTRT